MRPALAAVLLGCGAALSSAAERPTVFDLPLGTPAAALPAGFADFACGTGGGPPGRPLESFAEFGRCPESEHGLREVYFRYDDELEYVARALEQPRAVEALAGTRVYGIPVTASALFDAEGMLQGLRLATDPRGIEPGERNDHWALAAMLMHRFGDAGWICADLPKSPDESPVSTFLVKSECRKTTKDASFVVLREYLHRRGEAFTDEFGKAQTTHFVSQSRFEMLATP
jgi:hypothetical protein